MIHLDMTLPTAQIITKEEQEKYLVENTMRMQQKILEIQNPLKKA